MTQTVRHLHRPMSVVLASVLGLAVFLLMFVAASPSQARDHFDDYGPYSTAIGFWGCVRVAGSDECVSGARVTFSRHGVSATACSYEGLATPEPPGCPSAVMSHTVETFPFYGLSVTGLISDVANADGILTTPATFLVTVVYTGYSRSENLTVDAFSFDRFGERRLDITVGQWPGGAPNDDIFTIRDGTVIEQGRLRLSSSSVLNQLAASPFVRPLTAPDSALPVAAAASFTFTEGFTTYDLRDQTYTTAIWDVFSGTLRLDQLPGIGYQRYPSVIVDAAGNAYVVWVDPRYEFRRSHIFMRKFDANGNPLWPADIQIDDDAGRPYPQKPTLLFDADDNIIVAWSDGRTTFGGVFAQRVAPMGAKLWLADKRIDDNATNLFPRDVDATLNPATREIVVVWEDQRNSRHDIYTQWIDVNGTRRWADDKRVNLDTSVDHDEPAVGVDAAGIAYVTWYDSRQGHADIWAQKISSAGIRLWNDFRVNSDTGTSAQRSPDMVTDASGNSTVVWIDNRDGVAAIYAQRFDSNRVKQWAASAPGDVRVSIAAAAFDPMLALGSGGSTYVAWYVQPSVIAAQKLNVNGDRQWPSDIWVNDTSGWPTALSPAIAVNAANDIRVAWHDNRNDQRDDIFVQRLSDGGERLWLEDTPANSDRGTLTTHPVTRIGPNGYPVIVWFDGRNVYPNVDPYLQQVSPAGALQWRLDLRANTSTSSAFWSLASRPCIAINKNNGNVAVVWDNNTDVYAQMFDASGAALWSPGLRVNTPATGRQHQPSCAFDASGYLYVIWSDERGGANQAHIYAQKLSPSGQVQWPADRQVTIAGTATSSYAYPTLAFDEVSQSLYAAWQDFGSGTYDVYAQRLDLSGNRVWATDLPVSSGGASVSSSPSIAAVGGHAYLAWVDSANAVRVQKINSNGIAQWGGGVSQGSGQMPSIAVNAAGHSFIAWRRWSSGDVWHIVAQRLDAAGTPVWPSPVQVNDANGLIGEDFPSIDVGANNEAYVVWQDYRLGHPDIYVQGLLANGNRVWSADRRVNPDLYVPDAEARSLAVDQTSDNIVWATLNPSQTLPGNSSVMYFLSNNGGDVWTQVTPGVPLQFATTGSDLRWWAILSASSDQTQAPVVDHIQIAYATSAAPLTPVTGVTISGPTQGVVQATYLMTATAQPLAATQPITYRWFVSGQGAITHTAGLFDTIPVVWVTPGNAVVTVTATNTAGIIVTDTHSIAITNTPVITGFAISVPITPTGLTSWESYLLRADIPPGTSIRATVLDAARNPVPGFANRPLNDGVTMIDLHGINPATYASLRLRVDLAGSGSGASPELTGWQLSWNPMPAQKHQVVGQIFDGHGNTLRNASVSLWKDGVRVAETATNADGRYTLSGIEPQTGAQYRARVTLRQGSEANPVFQIRYATHSPYYGPVVYLQTPPLTFDTGSMFTSLIADFDFTFNQDDYENNLGEASARSRLDDLATMYYHMQQVTSFIAGDLGVTTMRSLNVNAYAPSNITSSAYYDRVGSAIFFSEAFSGYQNGSRPMNREWHETFHALMEDTLGTPPRVPYPTPDCPPDQPVNHGGWQNCSTADSWAEGWAEFWSAVLWDRLGWPLPELYRIGNSQLYAAISLEYDWQAWDRGCEQVWCPSREEFAVASLLWDLYDPVDQGGIPIVDDYVEVPRDELWRILGQNPAALNDMKDVYDALKAVQVGNGYHGGICGLNDLDMIFVRHGFYFDANYAGSGPHSYDCGEEIGRAADNARPGRRNAPIVEAVLDMHVTSAVSGGQAASQPGTTPITLTVSMVVTDVPSLSYSYTWVVDAPLDPAQAFKMYIEPPPTRTPVLMSISAQGPGSLNVNPFVMTNTEYWDRVSRTPPGTAVASHNFEMHDIQSRIFMPIIGKP